MKKILITGKNSYIGTSLEKKLLIEPRNYSVDTIDTKGEDWKGKDFSCYDAIFHVAGIAHVSSNPKLKELYYQVNRDLAIEIAKKSKSEGVKQFIFMSSIIVYGDSKDQKKIIDSNTEPKPNNFYGDSKLQAEKGIRALEDNHFNVVILRPPMIYGRNSKGNYPRLSKLAQKTPIFPNFNSERSMLHIDNLNEFIKLMLDNNETGIFFPQNKEYVNISKLVSTIADVHGKKIWLTKVFNPFISKLFKIDVVNKVFGSLIYDKNLSNYSKGNYQHTDFKESIIKTELP